MSAKKTDQECQKCPKCGEEMELLKGPFRVEISGQSRSLKGSAYICKNCGSGNSVPDEALKMSVMEVENW